MLLDVYTQGVLLIKKFLPSYGTLRPWEVQNMIQNGIGMRPPSTVEPKNRTQFNKWLLQTAAYIMARSKNDKGKPKANYLYLFRLLTLHHRIKFPVRGIPYKVDQDIRSFVQHKICMKLSRVLNNYSEDDPRNMVPQ